MKKITFAFDIDNTICKTVKNFYKRSKPNYRVIKLINKLNDDGHIIKIFTSRYMGRNNDNINFVKKKYYKIVKKDLVKWGVKFNKLILGKPSYDYIVDDKALNIKEKKTFRLLKNFLQKKK
jgi:hypothetical protein